MDGPPSVPRLPESDDANLRGAAAAARRLDLYPGLILGDRYRIERQLGRGGMGEVWQAFDLKLCVEVALKTLGRHETEARQQEWLRGEVRAARKVMSANVCRIYDLVEVDGHELVSMEYVDGANLREYLRQHGSPAMQVARDIAAQLLAGLQAIHDAGLVHRDLKPENVMLTRAGRVVVMDFGIARLLAEGSRGTIAGTPAYMAPEQARGEPVDARADIYSAGLVLRDLVQGDTRTQTHDGSGHATAGTNMTCRSPADVWDAAVRQALSPVPADRYASARSFAQALEKLTRPAYEPDDETPYPGLSAFTAENARFFFGREFDIEAVGRKLQRLHLLAVVGPSGVGKSSFLGAGLIPSLPYGWACVRCTPGPAPFVALGQALGPQLAGDTDALRDFFRFAEPDVAVSLFAKWRRRHAEALLVIDQFEELFTQNPPEVQTRFAELIGRLPVDAGVRVLLSLRDDFLFNCQAYPALRPIFTELTPLARLEGAELRRALVQPALACGYRFEDTSLEDRMLAEVQAERGALPLLAFTAARLWERRDVAQGLLTSAAYDDLGGVAGSLAQHAEATLERIGAERQSLVREIFRNLVTSHGTRVSRERGELLSVFPDRDAAAAVLQHLVAARLLTAFEVVDTQDAKQRRQRVEIVHESLLTHWPRLVRWQTQDADGAQLRDQLTQAAQLWEGSGRPDDMLWTGTVYREFSLWRERYPGGLTEAEEAFATALTARARRRQRRRRLAAISVFAALLVVLGVVGSLWRRADAEARRAESVKLYTLAQNEKILPDAFAYALAALELSDQPEYRRLAQSIMLQAPLPIRLPVRPNSHNPCVSAFSPDGKWLAAGWAINGGLQLLSLDGGAPRDLVGHGSAVWLAEFSEDSRWLATAAGDTTVRIWSVPEGQLMRTLRFPGAVENSTTLIFPRDQGKTLITCAFNRDEQPRWESWSPASGEGRLLGHTGERIVHRDDVPAADVDPTGSWAAVSQGKELLLYSLHDLQSGPVRRLGRHEEPIVLVSFGPDGDLVASAGIHGEVRVWSLAVQSEDPLRVLQSTQAPLGVKIDPTSTYLTVAGAGMRVWDLRSPGGAPIALNEGGNILTFGAAFHPNGTWMVTTGTYGLFEAWPLTDPPPITLEGPTSGAVVFAPDGSWLATASDGTIQLWPLGEYGIGVPRTLFHADDYNFWSLRTDDRGRYLYASVLNSIAGEQTLVMIALANGEVRTWHGASVIEVAAEGRWVASSPEGTTGRRARLWDTSSGQMTEFGTPTDIVLGFATDDRLLTARADSLFAWDVQTLRPQLVGAGFKGAAHLCPDRETVLLLGNKGRLALRRIDEQGTRNLPAEISTDNGVISIATRDSMFVLGRANGDVDVIQASSAKFHHLPIHGGDTWVTSVSVDPRGRWIASASNEVKLWRVPSGTPMQDLPRDEFLGRLRSLSNLRAVKSDKTITGYVIDGFGLPDWQHPARK